MTNNLRNKPQAQGGFNNKLLIALIIALIALFAIDKLEQKYAPVQAQELAEQAKNNPLAPNKDEVFGSKDVKTVAQTAKNIKPVDLKTDNFNAQVSSNGATITSLELAKYTTEKDGDENVKLIYKKAKNSDYGILFDAGWLANKYSTPDIATIWNLDSSTENSATFSYEHKNLKFIRKIDFVEGKFIANITDTVINKSNDENVDLSHFAQMHHIGEREDKLANSFTNYTGPEAIIDGEVVKASYSKLKDGDIVSAEGKNLWAGVTQQYFANAIIPSNSDNAKNNVKFKHNQINGNNYYTILVRSNVETLKPGAEITKQFSLYTGPKSINILKEQGFDSKINLHRMLDYGWFHFIANLFYKAIMFINQYIGHLAVSIIILTILIKIALYPLTKKSYVSMAKLRKLTPEMEKVKKKCGNDRQALGLEMMSLYKKHKVNPASGCLPMLLQIPIFFAMYKVILQSFEFRQAELGLWITDMSSKDPYFVLPILMGASMVIQQKLQPQPTDETQRMVMNTMPYAFTALFLFFPSGLVLYWLTNNVITIIQQKIVMKKYDAE